MSLWFWLLLAAALGYLTKLLAGTLTIGLLASLTVVNAAASGSSVVADARLGALVAAAVALWLKAPFLVVVMVGAAAAAGMRLLGVP